MPISVRRRLAGTCLLVLGTALLTLTQAAATGAAQTTGEIGDLVFWDDNDNGRADPEERGVAGVIVELFADPNMDGAPDGAVLQTAVSDGAGVWRFVGLSDGAYTVRIPASNWNEGGPLHGCRSSAPTTSDPGDGIDGDDNGFELAGVGILGGPVVLTAERSIDHSLDFGCHRPVFLVSLTAATTGEQPAPPADVLDLVVTVENQGTLNATELAVYVSFTDELSPNDPDWELLKDGRLLRHLSTDVLRPGLAETLPVHFDVDGVGPHEVMVSMASVRSQAAMPNGEWFSPDDPADVPGVVLTVPDGGTTTPEAGGSDEADAASAPDPTQPDVVVDEETTAVEDAAIVAQPESSPPRQAVSPGEVAGAGQEGAPVLALTGVENRALVLLALICIVAGLMLLTVERWLDGAPTETSAVR